MLSQIGGREGGQEIKKEEEESGNIFKQQRKVSSSSHFVVVSQALGLKVSQKMTRNEREEREPRRRGVFYLFCMDTYMCCVCICCLVIEKKERENLTSLTEVPGRSMLMR